MGTLATKYDTRQPSAGGAKGAYSAIVYIDGSQVVAEDADGKVVASGEAGTNDALVIQEGVTSAGEGVTFIKSQPTNKYILTSGISVPIGGIVDLGGSWFDVTALNNIVFSFANSDTPNDYLQGIRNGNFIGVRSNTSTLVAKFLTNPFGAFMEKIKTRNVCNGVWFADYCYHGIVRDCNFLDTVDGGIPIRIDHPAGTNAGNGIIIDHVDIEPGATGNGFTYPLYVDDADIWLNNVRFEGQFINGMYILNSVVDINNIQASMFLPAATGHTIATSSIKIHNGWMTSPGLIITGASNVLIENVVFDDAQEKSIITIPSTNAVQSVRLLNNTLKTIEYIFVLSCSTGSTVDFCEVSGNYITGSTGMTGEFSNQAAERCYKTLIVTRNRIYNMGNNGYNFMKIGALDGLISDNDFNTINVGGGALILSSGAIKFINNKFSTITGIYTFNAADIVKYNSGYVTENSGSSTGTGSEQTIAHGLAAVPVGCKAWIKYLVGSRYITEMIPFDATNIYPTVENGVAYEWRIE